MEYGIVSDMQPAERLLCQPQRFVNLLEMGESESDELKRRLTTTNGVLDILVHPYFYENIHVKSSDEYKRKRKTYLVDSFSRQQPLVIFEEFHKLDQLGIHLREMCADTVYSLSTNVADPSPATASWDDVAESLKDLDTKHIQLGGMRLTINAHIDSEKKRMLEAIPDKPYARQWLTEKYLPHGCVGVAAQKLLYAGFDVSFLSITTPGVYKQG